MNRKAEKILDATIRLFLNAGIKKTTMDEIAVYAGVSKVTIYKYFTDKDTLLLKIAQHIFSDYMENLNRIVSSDDVLIKKLYAFIDLISIFSDSGEYALCKELIEYDRTIEKEYQTYVMMYRRSLTSLIDTAVKSGMTNPHVDQEMLFYYIDMGIRYYQEDSDYRNRLRTDNAFQKRFMSFFVGNIFHDTSDLLSNYERN